MLEISLAAEPIFRIGSLAITNSVFASWIVVIILSILAFITRAQLALVPRSIGNFMEMVVNYLYETVRDTVQDEDKAKTFLPFIGTFFVFIIINNWFGLLPGFGSITINYAGHAVPLLRGGNADLNSTLALAIISVVTTQYYGIKYLGFFSHWKRFFNFSSPIMFAVGLLELIGEFAHVISFSFRLFGNIFAGEVLLLVIAFLVPIIAPLPFFGLELFVGLIQALVFTMLTLVFLTITTANHSEHTA